MVPASIFLKRSFTSFACNRTPRIITCIRIAELNLHILQRDNESGWSREGDESQKRVADEKRRWAISHFTSTGKPDVQKNQESAARRLRQLGVLSDDRLPGSRGASTRGLIADGPDGVASTRVTLCNADLLELTRPEAPKTMEELSDEQRESRLRFENRIRLHMRDYDQRFGNLFGGSGWEYTSTPPLLADGATATAGSVAGIPLLGNSTTLQLPLLADGTVSGASGAHTLSSPTALRLISHPAAASSYTTTAEGTLLLPTSPLAVPASHSSMVSSAAAIGSGVSLQSTPATQSLSVAQSNSNNSNSTTSSPADSLARVPAIGSSVDSGGKGGQSTTVGAYFGDDFHRQPEDEMVVREAQTDAKLQSLAYKGNYRSLRTVAQQGRVARFDPSVLAARHGALTGSALDSAVGTASGSLPDYEAVAIDESELAPARRIPDYLKQRHAASAAGATMSASQAIVPAAYPGRAGVQAASAAVDGIVARLRARGGAPAGSDYATVGTSGVLTVAAERAKAHADEAASYDILGARVNHLAAKVAAVSGQAEMQQYGAMLRPLMDGMTRLMLNMTSADGTEKEILSVEAQAAELTAARKGRLAELKAQRAEREAAGQSSSVSGGASSSTGGGRHMSRFRGACQPSAAAATSAASDRGISSRGGRPASTVAAATTKGGSKSSFVPAVSSARGIGQSTAGQRNDSGNSATARAATTQRPGSGLKPNSASNAGGGIGSAQRQRAPTAKESVVDFNLPAAKTKPTPTGLLVQAQDKLRQAAKQHQQQSLAAGVASTTRRASLPSAANGPPIESGGAGGQQPSSSTDSSMAAAAPDSTTAAHRRPPSASNTGVARWTLLDELASQRKQVQADKQQAKRRLPRG